LKEGLFLGGRLIESVRALRIEHGGEPIWITVSVGLCQALRGETADRWLEGADRALYDAKAQGRDRLAHSVPAT
jgi:PleD family two-component response regulator